MLYTALPEISFLEKFTCAIEKINANCMRNLRLFLSHDEGYCPI